MPPAPPIERDAVTSDIPTLLLAGDFDPITPPRWAEVARETLSRGQLVTFRGVGHGVLGTSACADGLVSAFLLTPTAAQDTRCVDRLPGVVFEVARPS